MKTTPLVRALALVLTLTSTALHAQVPQIINYQGRVAVGSPAVNFDGSGAFKFALVNTDGTTTYWSNDGTSTAGSEPTAAVTLPVTKGLYSVMLGANMTAIPATVFANADVRLRVWFNDGANGSQLLTPDQRLAAVGYAMVAGGLHAASKGDVVALLEADTDNSTETDNPLLRMTQDGGLRGVNIGFNETELPNNVFGIGSIVNGSEVWDVFTIQIETGNVGIGTTTPEYNLQLSRNDTNGVWLGLKNNSAAGHGWRIGSTGFDNGLGAGGLAFFDDTAWAYRMVISSAGKVGIGTASPATKLQVAGTVTATAFTGDGSGLTNLPSTANASEAPTNVFPAQGMVWIKPGTFLMGSRVGELGRSTRETQHPVTLTKGFWMGVHEVTQAEYTAVIGSYPSNFTGDTNRPVETVSWNNAVAYCAALTTAERTAGRIPATWEYRLPTEAEWEYCCRAGARTTRFGYGDDLAATSLGDYAWYSANSGGTTHPVEQKRPNAWGLMDMHGNVFEWCLDSTDGGDYPGGSAAVTDPRSVAGSLRVLRGGNWGHFAYGARCAYRNYSNPGNAGSNSGFRAVLAPGQ